MSKPYTVGRGSAADIRLPKAHDAVGKLHAQLEQRGDGQVCVTDLQSTNGTFVRVGGQWEEIKEPRVVSEDAEIMLGDYRTTPARLLAEAVTAPLPGSPAKKKYRSPKDEEPTPPTPPKAPTPPPPTKKRTGPRRNEFGEIIHE